MDYLIDSKLESIDGKLESLGVHLLQTPDQIYNISGNVIVPAGIEVKVGEANLELSYSDNQLSTPPTIDQEYINNLKSAVDRYLIITLGLCSVALVCYHLFRFFRKII